MEVSGLQGVVFAIAATIFEGTAQVFLKLASRGRGGFFGGFFWTAIGLVTFAVEAVVYTLALRSLSVGIAYPIGALSFVFVTLLSQWWLGERVDRTRWAGVLLIILGTALVAMSA
jgi:undecaprenyl phosphate-alpha-L-ara4N flippase subunit ArnE